MSINLCPCGSQSRYAECCDRFHNQGMHAKTVEALMRSRYCAYVLGNADYVMRTWTENERPKLTSDELSATQWLRLEVLNSKQGLKKGTVEFKAYFMDNNKECCLHEHSLFKKIKNRWYYHQAVDKC